MTQEQQDQALADRVHAAVKELNEALYAAGQAGLEADASTFAGFKHGGFVGHVRRVIPARFINYDPTPEANEAYQDARDYPYELAVAETNNRKGKIP